MNEVQWLPSTTMRRLLVVIILVLFVCVRWFNLDQDITSFIGLKASRIVPEHFHHDVRLLDKGYDGYHFYTFSLNPLAVPQNYTTADGSNGYHIDGIKQKANYIFRQKRIGYPLLVWMASGLGYAPLVPYMLVMVNVLCFILLLYIVDKVLCIQLAKWPSLLLPLTFLGAYVCVARDLSDLIALSLGLLGVYTYLQKRYIVYAVVGTLAVLTRETAFIFILLPFGLDVMRLLVRKERLTASSWLALVPVVAYVLWSLYLNETRIIDHIPPSIGNNLDWPFLGWIKSLNGFDSGSVLALAAVLPVYALSVEAIRAIRIRPLAHRKGEHLLFIFLMSGLLIMSLCMSEKIYEDFWSVSRNLLPLQVVSYLVIMHENSKVSKLNRIMSVGAFLPCIIYMMLFF